MLSASVPSPVKRAAEEPERNRTPTQVTCRGPGRGNKLLLCDFSCPFPSLGLSLPVCKAPFSPATLGRGALYENDPRPHYPLFLS